MHAKRRLNATPVRLAGHVSFADSIAKRERRLRAEAWRLDIEGRPGTALGLRNQCSAVEWEEDLSWAEKIALWFPGINVHFVRSQSGAIRPNPR